MANTFVVSFDNAIHIVVDGNYQVTRPLITAKQFLHVRYSS